MSDKPDHEVQLQVGEERTTPETCRRCGATWSEARVGTSQCLRNIKSTLANEYYAGLVPGCLSDQIKANDGQEMQREGRRDG